MKLKYKILTGIIAVLVVIQLFRIDKNIPEVDPKIDFITVSNAPPEIGSLMKSSCYDCHSFETGYPWYSNISPVSWWLKAHINDAREELNFSVWGSYSIKRKDHKLEEIADEVNEGHMPLPSYLILHQHAKLDDKQMDTFVNWINRYRQESQ